MKIAIQPDELLNLNGERQSYSERWTEVARAEGVSVEPVNVFSDDVIADISGCDAFMWRFPPSAHPRRYAMRLLVAIEQALRIPVFPSLETSWHFDDKIAQHYFLNLAGIATPATHVFWTRPQAEAFCSTASYPFVLKLSSGHKATNVRLVHNRDDALYYVERLFGPGLVSLGYKPASPVRLSLRRLRTAVELLRGRYPNSPNLESDLQYGYFLAQEFLPGNEFDTRITVIGNRAFAFRRFNRPGDFRASGSGLKDYNPEAIGEDAVRLAFKVARILRAQTVAVDVLRRGAQPVIVELGLAYPSRGIRDCPGHWMLEGEPSSGRLAWVEGSTRAEDVIFFDFMTEVRQSVSAR